MKTTGGTLCLWRTGICVCRGGKSFMTTGLTKPPWTLTTLPDQPIRTNISKCAVCPWSFFLRWGQVEREMEWETKPVSGEKKKRHALLNRTLPGPGGVTVLAGTWCQDVCELFPCAINSAVASSLGGLGHCCAAFVQMDWAPMRTRKHPCCSAGWCFCSFEFLFLTFFEHLMPLAVLLLRNSSLLFLSNLGKARVLVFWRKILAHVEFCLNWCRVNSR